MATWDLQDTVSDHSFAGPVGFGTRHFTMSVRSDTSPNQIFGTLWATMAVSPEQDASRQAPSGEGGVLLRSPATTLTTEAFAVE